MQYSMIDHANRYVRAGFPVIPLCWPDKFLQCGCWKQHVDNNIGKAPLLDHGLKDATLTQLGVKEYWGKWPLANIGVVIPKEYFVLDIDTKHDGYDSLLPLQEIVGELPKTLQITTGAGGAHFWYKTDKPIGNKVELAGLPGIDVRGLGGYVVAPPSLHRFGKRYEKSPVWDGAITQAPQALIELCLKGKEPTSQANEIPAIITDGTRDSTLTSLAGSLRRRGLSEETIYLSLSEVNKRQCNPPLADYEVRKIAHSTARYTPASNNYNQERPDYK